MRRQGRRRSVPGAAPMPRVRARGRDRGRRLGRRKSAGADTASPRLRNRRNGHPVRCERRRGPARARGRRSIRLVTGSAACGMKLALLSPSSRNAPRSPWDTSMTSSTTGRSRRSNGFNVSPRHSDWTQEVCLKMCADSASALNRGSGVVDMGLGPILRRLLTATVYSDRYAASATPNNAQVAAQPHRTVWPER